MKAAAKSTKSTKTTKAKRRGPSTWEVNTADLKGRSLPAGLRWDQLLNADREQREAWKRLRQVNDLGRRAALEYAADEKALASIAMELVRLEAQVAELNNQIQALSYPPETFAHDAKLPEAQQQKVDKLEAERGRIMQERRSLKAQDGQKRMAMIRLAREIQNLRQSRKNLEAVVRGENPAKGWEGGCFYLTGA